MTVQSYSILRCCRLRPLAVALAHRLANTKPGDPYSLTLERLYSALSEAQQVQCGVELARGADR